MPICKICNTSFPNHISVNGKVRNLQNRKYCIKCSPFGEHNTRKIDKKSPLEVNKKFCPRCKKEKLGNEFYKRRSDKDFSPYCKECSKEEVICRQRKFKKKCIDYKGGECSECGFSTCDAAMEFHHLDPSKKDFSISRLKLTSFDNRVIKELDKCILLCANCHRMVHTKMVG